MNPEKKTPANCLQQTLGNDSVLSGARSTNRRSFLGALIGVGSVAVGALLSVPLIRFAIHPLLSKTTETAWSEIGSLEELFSINAPVKRLVTVEHRDGWRKVVSEKPVYVVKDTGILRVLSPICPHLGCSISWRESQSQFVCPCHVGIFSTDGTRISGPAPRAMDELESKVENGRLKVRYQYFRQLIPTKEVLG